MRFAFALLISLSAGCLFSQTTPAMDSLTDALSQCESPSCRVKNLLELHAASASVKSVEERMQYLHSALQMSMEESDYLLSLNTLSLLTRENTKVGNVVEAEKYGRRAVAIMDHYKCDTTDQAANIYFHLSSALRKQGKLTDASEVAFRGLEVAELIKDSVLMGSGHNAIGILFYMRKDSAKSLDHLRRAIQLIPAADPMRRAELKANIALIYSHMNIMDSAWTNFQSALFIMQQQPNNDFRLARMNLLIGGHYNERKDKVKAGKFFQEAMYYAEQGNYRELLAEVYLYYGNFLIGSGQETEGFNLFMKGKELVEELNLQKLKQETYQKLHTYYAAMGNYKGAYETHVKLMEVSDAINKEIYENQITHLELQNDNKVQEEKIRALNREKELDREVIDKQDQLLLLGTIGGAVVSVLLVLVLVGYRNKRKTNKLLEDKNKEVETKNKEILDSIQYARNIQESLLPGEDLAAGLGINGMVFYKPRDIVSGDFYWYHKVNGGVVVAVVDCTGHGVPGALMSMLGHSGLSAAVTDGNLSDPGEILEFLSNYVISALDQEHGGALSKDGMDMSLCFISDDRKTLRFAGANNSALLIKGEEIEVLAPTKRPIGYYINSDPFQTVEKELTPGDKIYMFSDGYPDQFGGTKGKKLKLSNFRKLIKQVAVKPVSEQAEHLEKHFEDWKGSLEQLDDVCVLGLVI